MTQTEPVKRAEADTAERGRITDAEVERLRGKLGQRVDVAERPYLTEANGDAIRRWAAATGDRNPLYADADYAAKSPFAGIVAPPCLPYAFSRLSIGYRGGLPGCTRCSAVRTGNGSARTGGSRLDRVGAFEPRRRPCAPLAEFGYLTNEDVFDLSDLPGRLAVIGGGPIGVELAQALHRQGSTVTVLQHGPHLIPRDDTEMIDVLQRQFADEGIDEGWRIVAAHVSEVAV
jgi:NADPH-dependent 2,4-dienoyl-CoA reductase/sulfur reductase-like enzyme